ncbi:KH domain-containing protein [Platanthera guangdongensis]|uniref:KH domain-containing protein n=1 Tax=Platanthera guangdongensis TaxID=2320717 RepID=A0ABR2MGZ0_9ASPA
MELKNGAHQNAMHADFDEVLEILPGKFLKMSESGKRYRQRDGDSDGKNQRRSKGGKVINSIRQETHAKIKVVDPFSGAQKRVMNIYCFVKDKEQVDADDEITEPLCPAQDALLRVHTAIANALSNTKDADEDVNEEVELLVPTSQASNIIGKSGSIIKKLRAKTKANIKINPKDPNNAAHSSLSLSVLFSSYKFLCKEHCLLLNIAAEIMGLVRSPSLRSEEYFEGIIKDYVNGKGSAKMNRGCNKRSSSSSTPRLVVALTLPFHHVWILFFGSPKEPSLKRIVEGYNNSKISFISSSYDFKYYGRFQMALQTESDFVYIVDDDMIPEKKMLEILAHVGSTEKYKNSVLGSIGRILPFRQKDFTFPSYRKLRTKEAGLYLPDPAYGITVDRIVQVDFLSSSWFLSSKSCQDIICGDSFHFHHWRRSASQVRYFLDAAGRNFFPRSTAKAAAHVRLFKPHRCHASHDAVRRLPRRPFICNQTGYAKSVEKVETLDPINVEGCRRKQIPQQIRLRFRSWSWNACQNSHMPTSIVPVPGRWRD